MAVLGRYQADTKKINEGDWVTLTDYAEGDLDVKVKGFTDAYSDARTAKFRSLAQKKYGGDLTKITNGETRQIVADLLARHCIVDVRNLFDQDGQPVGVDTFKAVITDDAGSPDYPHTALYVAVLGAIAEISNAIFDSTADAKKN